MVLVAAACGQGSGGDSNDDSGSGSSGATSGGSGGAGGGTTASASFPVTIEDSLDRQVRIGQEPEEIASMVPSVTETLFEVGAGDRVVGVSEAGDYPEEVESIEEVGNYNEVNAEKIASLQTDLLFLSYDSTTEDQAESLQDRTGAKVVVINPTSVDEAIQSIGTVGEVVGNEDQAEAVEERLRSELDDLRSEVEGLPEPEMFYEVGYDPLFTAGPGSFVNDAINLAGGENIAADAGQAYPQYSVEKILEDDPRYYLAGESSGATVKGIKSRQQYSSLTAVEQDKVFVINDDLVTRPGPRIVDGVREIAEVIHPEAFDGESTTGGG